MNQKNLLASVALFGQLYNSDKYKDIISVIGSFIKGAILFNKKYSLTSFEIKQLLEDTYDFQILESVIRTVLHSTLKDEFEYEKGTFCFNDSIKTEYIDLDTELVNKNKINDSIFAGLKKYVSEKENRILTSEDEKELFDNFNQFLFDNGSTEKYTNHISSFIIKNEDNVEIVDNLNLIREGLILYQGLRFTADIDKLGKWKTKLVIYLNTEYLFNALGYNGILFKDIFFDFYKLITEINSQSNSKLITLKYLPETKEEIESFFYSAESILARRQKLRPWKTAMKMLVESCQSASDIVSKKVNFYSELEKLDIELEPFEYELEEYSAYNVVDEKIIASLKQISKEKGKYFDEENCYLFFRMFTKVNFFRKGKSNKPFEKIGYIFISDSGFAKYLGHNNNVKMGYNDTSFAKDIDYITTRFWIKLKKGFSEKTEFPKSFNVLTKARIILSSQISSSLSKEYDKLVKEKNDGKLTDEEAIERSYSLREKPNLPNEITPENIDSTFDFLNNEEYLQNVYQEKIRKEELIKEAQLKNIELQKEIDRRDRIDKEREEKEIQKRESERIAKNVKAYEKEMGNYNKEMDIFCSSQWSKFLKESKHHFWSFLLFVLFVVTIFFILVSFRDKILILLNIEITDEIKSYYSGLIMAIGFIATTIRSFYDTKNTFKGFKLIFNSKYRRNLESEKLIGYKKLYKSENAKPIKIE